MSWRAEPALEADARDAEALQPLHNQRDALLLAVVQALPVVGGRHDALLGELDVAGELQELLDAAVGHRLAEVRGGQRQLDGRLQRLALQARLPADQRGGRRLQRRQLLRPVLGGLEDDVGGVHLARQLALAAPQVLHVRPAAHLQGRVPAGRDHGVELEHVAGIRRRQELHRVRGHADHRPARVPGGRDGPDGLHPVQDPAPEGGAHVLAVVRHHELGRDRFVRVGWDILCRSLGHLEAHLPSGISAFCNLLLFVGDQLQHRQRPALLAHEGRRGVAAQLRRRRLRAQPLDGRHHPDLHRGLPRLVHPRDQLHRLADAHLALEVDVVHGDGHAVHAAEALGGHARADVDPLQQRPREQEPLLVRIGGEDQLHRGHLARRGLAPRPLVLRRRGRRLVGHGLPRRGAQNRLALPEDRGAPLRDRLHDARHLLIEER
mmetsp:Transcript_14557/g.41581  ORF Transcript_14557/g.41581 Transcript_14557/m.41581 type:complete len:435 (-) Transcript_14557:97-1401(-)